jgi:hypothetical protein
MSLRIAGTDDELEMGTMYIHWAGDLWSLAGDERRARRIHDWPKDYWTTNEDDPETKVYWVGGLEHLLGLIEGLDDALRATVTDQHWRIDAETAARIRTSNECLVDSWDEEGRTVYTLANRVSEVYQLEGLLRRAIEMDRHVEVI